MIGRFPTILSALTSAFEATINQALEYDPASRQRIAQLSQVLTVECDQPEVTIHLRGSDNGVVVSHGDALAGNEKANDEETKGDARLKGSAIALFSLLKEPNASLANSDVSVTGNLDLLQQWQTVLGDLDIDWQGWFSRYLGDTAGGWAGQAFGGLWAYAKQQQQTVVELASQYFSDERQWVPHSSELDQFYCEIDDLVMAADRLAARISQLTDEPTDS